MYKEHTKMGSGRWERPSVLLCMTSVTFSYTLTEQDDAGVAVTQSVHGYTCIVAVVLLRYVKESDT